MGEFFTVKKMDLTAKLEGVKECRIGAKAFPKHLVLWMLFRREQKHLDYCSELHRFILG